ncbi:MAG: glycosyltransferase family 9 protein [Pseudomonadota bacterium]
MFWLILTWIASPVLWLACRIKQHQKPKRILVVQTAKIGDFVNTTPVFRALRKHIPYAHVTALIHSINLPLAQHLDSIDEVVTLPANGFRGWQGKIWFYRLLRRRFDSILVLSPNLATYLVPLWACIPRRISLLPDRRIGIARLAWPFLSHGIQHLHGRLFRETALHALSGLGIEVTPQVLAMRNEVPAPPIHAQQKAAKIRQDGLGQYIGLGISAGNPMKSLPTTSLLELAAAILAATDATLVLIGTKRDRQTATDLQSKLVGERVINTTGEWRLEELAALLSTLDAYIGVDSGVTYLADALDVPVIDIMGPADAEDQRPLGPNSIIIKPDAQCAPCSHAFDSPYVCHNKSRICLSFSPEMIVAALRSCFQSKPQSTDHVCSHYP